MRFLGRVLPLAFVVFCDAATCQGQELARTSASHGTDVGVSIMSDTKGVSLDPYMKTLIVVLRAQWQKQLTDRKLKSTADAEASVVDLTISPNGKLFALRLEPTESTARDQAAWEAVKSAHYAALPSGMKNAELKLRVEFLAD